MKPLEQWICDKCGGLIEKPFDGYAVWNCDEEFRVCDFKILHHQPCAGGNRGESSHLEMFLGVNGLAELLSLVDFGPIGRDFDEGDSPGFKNSREFVDFVRRVQISYYEEARQYFNEPEVVEQF